MPTRSVCSLVPFLMSGQARIVSNRAAISSLAAAWSDPHNSDEMAEPVLRRMARSNFGSIVGVSPGPIITLSTGMVDALKH